ncbi:MAG: hypothetical protein AB8U25_01480 [Rickettsiales endosymbiont of Dermacentor nuttalli]
MNGESKVICGFVLVSSSHSYWLEQKCVSQEGQYPSTVILSCIDSRASAEVVFDTGIAGVKVILIMGYTKCDTIKGAIDGSKLGNLTTSR